MKHFLLMSAIICALAFSVPGCGESPGNKDAAADKSAEDVKKVSKDVASGIKKTGEAVEQAAQETRQAIADTAGTAAEVVESATEEAAQAVDAVKETVSAAAAPVSAAATQGTATVADVIEMKNTAAFSTHLRGIVMFTHKKHTATAPAGYGIACGQCHHDQDGKPLALKEGDIVQGCMACHVKAGKPKKPEGISKADWDAMQLEYYYGAIHANCIDCHKAGEAGPVKCNECHPTEKK